MSDMITTVVSIGNTDNRLTQQEWSRFVYCVNDAIVAVSVQVHFWGFSPGNAAWQNTAWYFDIKAHDVEPLKERLAQTGGHYKQDSVAWLQGNTEFIEGAQDE